MPIHPRQIRIEDYTYGLPEERIPLFPSAERGGSKLLYAYNDKIQDQHFSDLPALLPAGAMLVFNQSKVIPARLVLHRDSGARIEVFLLKPIGKDYQQALQANSEAVWSCLIGGAKKWKDGEVLTLQLADNVVLQLNKGSRVEEYFEVCFQWSGAISFAEVLEFAGKIPLPPYIHRETTKEDAERYQTIYATQAGSVAAPTAGLHFTEEILSRIQLQGHPIEYLTLHVGAGTFKPVSATKMEDHHMHTEHFVVSKTLVDRIIQQGEKAVIPVGTTSMRTLESLYWLGVACMANPNDVAWEIGQWDAYNQLELPAAHLALGALSNRMQQLGLEEQEAKTSILIAPGYEFHVCQGLITNFHQPQSTLLLLVAALLGEDWKKVYAHALANGYRFLSYGDSSYLRL